MLESTSKYSFLDIESNVDITTKWFFSWTDDPSTAAEQLTARIKLAAKTLSGLWDVPRSKALECVASAIGYSSWHILTLALKKLSSVTASTVSHENFKKLKDVATLLVPDDPEVRLEDHRHKLLTAFGERISSITGIPIRSVMDSVCAGLCDAASWSHVEGRNPQHAAKPLYEFHFHDGRKQGYLSGSPACNQLSEHLAECQHDSPERRPWLEETLSRQPGFLKGALDLALDLIDESRDGDAVAILDRSIKLVERIIPTGFRGSMDADNGDNETYLVLLYIRSRSHFQMGEIRKALRDARRLLRLDPWDEQGIRFLYPLMLLKAGEYESADKATKHLTDEYHVSLPTIAFCKFTVGDRWAFEHYLTLALIDLPPLRWMLKGEEEHLPGGDDGYRHYRDRAHDGLYEYVEFAWSTYQSVPGLADACVELLSSPAVVETESRFRKLWMDRKRLEGAWLLAREEFARANPKRRFL